MNRIEELSTAAEGTPGGGSTPTGSFDGGAGAPRPHGRRYTSVHPRFSVVAYGWSMAPKPDPAEIDDVEPLADDTASQARRVVAAYATDADECRVFLSMLGIGPAKLGA